MSIGILLLIFSQEKSPQEILATAEQALERAETVRVQFTSTARLVISGQPSLTRMSGSLEMKGRRKVRADFEVKFDGGTVERRRILSNGETAVLFIQDRVFRVTPASAQVHHSWLRMGLYDWAVDYSNFISGNDKPDGMPSQDPISELKAEAGTPTAVALSFLRRSWTGSEPAKVRLECDATRFLPLGWHLEDKIPSGSYSCDEVYEKVSLGVDLSEEDFRLPEGVEAEFRDSVKTGQGKLLDTISSRYVKFGNFQFDRTGEQVAYFARTAGKEFIIVNGRRGDFFDSVDLLTLGTDGKTFSYRAKAGDGWHLVIGDRKSDAYDMVWPPVFSPDGKHVAYVARKGGKEFFVVDGKGTAGFEKVTYGSWSPDGRRYAYQAEEGGKVYVVVDGEKSVPYDEVHFPVFCHNGTQVAFGARLGKESFVMVGGARGTPFDSVTMPHWNPDGMSVAYSASVGTEAFVVWGSFIGEKCAKISGLQFAPDGKSMAYVGGTTDRAGQPRAVMYWKGKPGRTFDGISSWEFAPNAQPSYQFIFSPDSTRLAYIGKEHGKAGVVVRTEGSESMGDLFDQVGTLTFSADGSRLAYVVTQKGRQFVLAGEFMSGVYDLVSAPQFSADGKILQFGYKKGGNLFWKSVPLN